MSKQTLWAMTNEGAQNGAEQKKESNDKPDITSGHFSNFPELEELLDQISGKKDEIDSSKYHALARMLGYEGDGSNKPQHTSEVGNNNDADYDDNDVDRATFYIMFRLLPSGEQGTSLSEKYLNGSGKIDPTDDGQNYDGDYSWPYRANLIRDEFGLHKLDAAGELIDSSGNKIDHNGNSIGNYDNKEAYEYLLGYLNDALYKDGDGVVQEVKDAFHGEGNHAAHGGIPVYFALLAHVENPLSGYKDNKDRPHVPSSIEFSKTRWKRIEIEFFRDFGNGLEKIELTNDESDTNNFLLIEVNQKKIYKNGSPPDPGKEFYIFPYHSRYNQSMGESRWIYIKQADCRNAEGENLDDLTALKIEGDYGRFFASYYFESSDEGESTSLDIGKDNKYAHQYYSAYGNSNSGITIGMGYDSGTRHNANVFDFQFRIHLIENEIFRLKYQDKISDELAYFDLLFRKQLEEELKKLTEYDKNKVKDSLEVREIQSPSNYDRSFEVTLRYDYEPIGPNRRTKFINYPLYVCDPNNPSQGHPNVSIELENGDGWIEKTDTDWDDFKYWLKIFCQAHNINDFNDNQEIDNTDEWYVSELHEFTDANGNVVDQQAKDKVEHFLKRAVGVNGDSALTLHRNYRDIFNKVVFPEYQYICPAFYKFYQVEFEHDEVSRINDNISPRTKMNVMEKAVVSSLHYQTPASLGWNTIKNTLKKAIDMHSGELLEEVIRERWNNPAKDRNFKSRYDFYKAFIYNNQHKIDKYND